MALLTQYASFFISPFGEKSVTDELNAFLRSHRIVNVEKRLIDGERGSRKQQCARLRNARVRTSAQCRCRQNPRTFGSDQLQNQVYFFPAARAGSAAVRHASDSRHYFCIIPAPSYYKAIAGRAFCIVFCQPCIANIYILKIL